MGIVVVVGDRRHWGSRNYRFFVYSSSRGRLGRADRRNGSTQTTNAATHRRRGSGGVLPVDLMAGTTGAAEGDGVRGDGRRGGEIKIRILWRDGVLHHALAAGKGDGERRDGKNLAGTARAGASGAMEYLSSIEAEEGGVVNPSASINVNVDRFFGGRSDSYPL